MIADSSILHTVKAENLIGLILYDFIFLSLISKRNCTNKINDKIIRHKIVVSEFHFGPFFLLGRFHMRIT